MTRIASQGNQDQQASRIQVCRDAGRAEATRPNPLTQG